LDPSRVEAIGLLGPDYAALGQFEKALEYHDKAIRLSPHDPNLFAWIQGKASRYIELKRYDEAIEAARQSIAIRPNNPHAHKDLIAALALSGQEAEAHEALRRYLALPGSGYRTIAAWKAYRDRFNNPQYARYLESWDRKLEGLRKAGMPEGE
jgi:adenylate cyclase